jgi:hypothetical protein
VQLDFDRERDAKYHAWLLPGEEKARFAIGWNGVIYPVKAVGAPADLEKDIAGRTNKLFWRNGNSLPMSISMTCIGNMPLHVAFLQRLGKVELAEKVWREGYAGEEETAAKDPYAKMAGEWLGCWYSQAVAAHLQGDGEKCLEICGKVLTLRKTVEATAARRGVSKKSPLYLEELGQLPELAADEERRAHEPPYTPLYPPDAMFPFSPPQTESGPPAHDPKRIAALIRDLEGISVHQIVNPGQTDVSTSATVQALIGEGVPAIDPLLDCLEKDTRLTRSRFTCGMGGSGPIIPVYEAAYDALVGMLKQPFFFSETDVRKDDSLRYRDPRRLSLEDRKLLAANIRACWERYKAPTLAERWYAMLKDDHAGTGAWVFAVNNIVQPTNVYWMPETMFERFGSRWWEAPGVVAALQGEPLRGKAHPSVSDLILNRTRQFMRRADAEAYAVEAAKLIVALADWEGKAHRADAQDLARKFPAFFPHSKPAFEKEPEVYRKIEELAKP